MSVLLAWLSKLSPWLANKITNSLGIYMQSTRKAARALCDATWDMQRAAWELNSLYSVVAMKAKDRHDQEIKIFEKIDGAFRVFVSDYDVPARLADTAREELKAINLGLMNMRAFSMMGQHSDMAKTALDVQCCCERVREAARPYAYALHRRLNNKKINSD
jgi:hypothetical protein